MIDLDYWRVLGRTAGRMLSSPSQESKVDTKNLEKDLDQERNLLSVPTFFKFYSRPDF
jgi:hypothetical protein